MEWVEKSDGSDLLQKGTRGNDRKDKIRILY